jgi:hypothetical protein
VTANGHPLALRTPWYVLERPKVPVPFTDPEAQRPVIQKYDSAEFVQQLIADPRQSLQFHDKEDVWSFPVPVGAFQSGASGRGRFATHRLVYTSMRKLYQPSHDRFYAVTVELFCDQPGLPRPSEVAGLELRFVVRRESFIVDGDADAARQLACDLAVGLDDPSRSCDPDVPTTDDVDDVLWVSRTEGRALTGAQLAKLAVIRPRRVVEAWGVDAAGGGRWTEITDSPALADGEQEYSMWRLPPRPDDCAPARSRSLWFGIVPTFSADIDAATARPKLDDRSIYRLRCFVRQPREPGCPPKLFWSEPTAPFRLASFYDPQGTKNRRVSITMPDFRTLSARAGEPQGPGGVEIVRPPGSQLKFGSDRGRPVNESTTDFGSVTSRCTFAIELLMIVAMFLFSLFLPVVVFIFQLWWLLLLRFCFPRPGLTLQLLATHFANGGTLGSLPDGPTGPAPLPDRDLDKRMLDDDLFEAQGATKGLLAADPTLAGDEALGKALVDALDPLSNPTTPIRTPEPVPKDPLCEGDALLSRPRN